MENSNRTIKYGIDEKEIFYLVDGQQRLTTSILLLKAFFLRIVSLNNKKVKLVDLKQLEKNYLHNSSRFKFLPHEVDQNLFKKIILLKSNNDINSKIPEKDIDTPSSKKILEVYLYFVKELKLLKDKDIVDNFMKFRNKFKFMKYEVDNEQDAIRIFNTTNDRGLSLNYLDKTKSWSIYYADRNILSKNINKENLIENINLNFSTIIKTSSNISKNSYLYDDNRELKDEFSDDSIQKYHYVFYDKVMGTSEDQLYHFKYYNTLLKYFKTKRNYELETYLEKYFSSLQYAFTSFENFLNNEKYKEEFIKIINFSKLYYVYPIICSVFDKLENIKDKKIFLKAIEFLMFRVYAIGNRSPRTDVYSFANDFYNKKIDFSELITKLKEFIKINQKMSLFKHNLEKISMGYPCKYLLLEYENSLRNGNGEKVNIRFEDYLEYEIEHIIAQDFGKDSEKFKKCESNFKDFEEAFDYITRIGNLTLAPKGWNASWGNSNYKQKAFLIDVGKDKKSEVSKKYKYASYESSSLWVQRDLTIKYAKKPNMFLKENIDNRTEDIIDFSKKKWDVNNIK